MWSLRLFWTWLKKINYLNSLLSTRRRTILTSSRTVLNAMMQCMFTDNYDSSFCFWVFEKSYRGIVFSFVKFMVGLTVLLFKQSTNFYCPTTFQTFMVSVQGRQDLSISYQKRSCFSHNYMLCIVSQI